MLRKEWFQRTLLWKCQPPRGSTLVLAAWMVSLLSLMAIGLGSQVLFGLDLADRLRGQMKAYEAAAGGLAHGLYQTQKDDDPKVDVPHEGWMRMDRWVHSRGSEVTVDAGEGMMDEDGKLNLNTAPVDVLRNLLVSMGLSSDDARGIADSIADWRDEDSNESPSGAEGITYRGGSPGYDCKDGPFESVEELLLVRGVTPGLWKRLALHLTVYGYGRLNLNTADQECLAALGLSSQGLASLLAYRVGEDALPETGDERSFESLDALLLELGSALPVEDQQRLTQLQEAGAIGMNSKAFTLSITAWTPQKGSSVRLTGVLDRSGRILSWREE